jgi:streptogramin lyase
MRRLGPLPGLLAVCFLIVAGCSASTGTPATTGGPSGQAPATSDLPTLTAQATVAGFAGPVAVVATNDSVWVLDHDGAAIVRIDPATNQVSAKVALGGGGVSGLGVAGGRLWTFHQTSGEIVAIDPAKASIVKTVKLGQDGDPFWLGDGAAWLVTGGALDRIDGTTAKVTSLPLDATCALDGEASGGGFVWLASADGGLCKVDEQSGAVIKRAAGTGNGSGIAVVAGAPWLAGADNGLAVIDPTTLGVRVDVPPPAAGTFDGATYSLGNAGGESSIVVGAEDGKSGWLRYTGATIARVNLSGTPAAVLYAGLPAGTFAGGVAEAFGSLWVTNFGAAPSVVRYQLPG